MPDIGDYLRQAIAVPIPDASPKRSAGFVEDRAVCHVEPMKLSPVEVKHSSIIDFVPESHCDVARQRSWPYIDPLAKIVRNGRPVDLCSFGWKRRAPNRPA